MGITYILVPPVGLPDLANANTACSVKLEFQMNNEKFHTKTLCIENVYRKIFIVFMEFKLN